MASNRYLKTVFAASEDVTSGELVIKIADLPDITASQMSAASSTTGDWPTFVMSFLCQVHNKVSVMSAADAPDAFTIQRSDQYVTSGDWPGKRLTQFVVRAYTEADDISTVSPDLS